MTDMDCKNQLHQADDLAAGNGDKMPANASKLIGRTADGSRVIVTAEFRRLDRDMETRTHERVSGGWELSLTGEVIAKHCREPWSCGQIQDHLADVVDLAPGVTAADVAQLAAIWERWHLNGMSAACAHQIPVFEDSDYGRRPSLELTPACPVTGYRYGHAWLFEALPADVVARVGEMFGISIPAEMAA